MIEDKSEKTSHPWSDFLEARKKAIIWLKKDFMYDDAEIAKALSMDATQVYLIRTLMDIQNES